MDLRGKIPIIDADTIVYSSAFAAQKDGVAEEPSHAFYNAKLMVKRTLEAFGNPDEWRLFLGGKDNYRVSLATILPYKGNRPPKPILYQEVRDYLCNFWQAEIVDGMEAEDMAAIVYNGDPEHNVFCAVDKDVLQIAGHHYNYKKNSYQHVSPLKANLNLWSQVLTGDRTDSILGIPGMGEKGAESLLKNVRTFREGWNVCEGAYRTAFGSQKCLQKPRKDGKPTWQYEEGEGLVRHDGSVIGWYEALLENCQLIWLLREPGGFFEPLY